MNRSAKNVNGFFFAFGFTMPHNRVWKGIFWIRDFTKKRCRIQDLAAPGKRDSLKLGM